MAIVRFLSNIERRRSTLVVPPGPFEPEFNYLLSLDPDHWPYFAAPIVMLVPQFSQILRDENNKLVNF
jgi:hypothetical protein